MTEIVIVVAIVLAGLFAGLFATFSYAVMPGLRRADDPTFAHAMREINVAILNPVLALVFGGSVLTSIAAAILGYDDERARWWLVAGAVLVAAAGMVTIGINVPMNDRLEAGVSSGEPPASLRKAFEEPWVRWNLVRTVLSTTGFAALVVALVA
ncbi:DUF1772 domain-containing protein [Aeromicrobium sp.]|uniref:anthrone oxygenase family protein n=1 Tax=Aeromicrobium sp. TaxID=1871063 RepID=UPI003D6B6400